MSTIYSQTEKAKYRIRKLIDKLKTLKGNEDYTTSIHKVSGVIYFSVEMCLISPEEGSDFIEEINNI